MRAGQQWPAASPAAPSRSRVPRAAYVHYSARPSCTNGRSRIVLVSGSTISGGRLAKRSHHPPSRPVRPAADR